MLVVDQCPNEGAAAAVLRRALDDVGLTRVPIRTRVVVSEDEASRLRFTGSPTVLIDGKDPFEVEGRPFGLTCRVYRTDNGRSGVPDLRQLRQAMKRHADQGRA